MVLLFKLNQRLNLRLEHPVQVWLRIFLEVLNLPQQIVDLRPIPILLILLRLIAWGSRSDLFQS